MKITPLEIRQKTFEKKIRGYDKDEVNAFLMSMSQEWERLLDENKERGIRMDASKKEIDKLREVESSLYKTLKTAEDTGANMIDQANKTAELHLRETQLQADSLLNEAKSKAKNMIEEAEGVSRRAIDEMERQIHELYKLYRDIEKRKESLVSEVTHAANNSLEKMSKLDKQSPSLDIEKHLANIKNQVKTRIPSIEARAQVHEPGSEDAQDNNTNQEKRDKSKADSGGSFFDNI